MKEIPLSKCKVALVDDEDYELLIGYKWFANGKKGILYAVRAETTHSKPKQRFIKMHRQLVGVIDPKILVDHRDRDPLNNQRNNLRVCNHSKNQANKVMTPKTSKFLGVHTTTVNHPYGVYKYFRAAIAIKGKTKNLGNFKDEEKAARAYDEAARKEYGEFANLNFK